MHHSPTELSVTRENIHSYFMWNCGKKKKLRQLKPKTKTPKILIYIVYIIVMSSADYSLRLTWINGV